MNLSFYSSFLNGLANQEAQISTLQEQISTGSTVQTAAQNPAAYETASLASDQISQLTNDSTTQSAVQTQLGAANGAYSSMSSLLDSVQSLIEQGLNGTANDQNLNALANQVQSASQQLLSLGNTQLPDGSYLFGGTRGQIPPFQIDSTGTTPGGVAYYGDSGQSQVNIDGGTTANALVTGDVLTSGLSGDGTSFVQANTDNTGTAQITQQGLSNVQQANAFQASSSPITVTFSKDPTSGVITYMATQGTGKNIQNLTPKPVTLSKTSGGDASIVLDGVNYQVTGSPANGDSFTISPARPQSAFTLLKNIASALSGSRDTPAQIAQTNQSLSQSLAGLNQYQQVLTTAEAQNGVTMQALTNAQTNTSTQKNAAQSTINNATAVNMPAAITALNQTMSALEASMKTFAEAQSLSLFKYL